MLVLLIAMVAAGALFVLRQVHDRQIQSSATRSVADLGRLIVSYLARRDVVTAEDATSADWAQFSRVINSLHTVEDGLQYVSVTRNGVTLFQEQTGLLETEGPEDTHRRLRFVGPVKLGRRRLVFGTQDVPVVTFTATLAADNGDTVNVEIGLRRETLEREETIRAGTIVSMFKLSLATILVSFGICTVMVAWMIQRELARERHRREEEHLTFAGVMANGIVHDFRNPMSSLHLDVQMLQREAQKTAPEGRVAQLAERIRQTLSRMDQVFQEFSYLSKPSQEALEAVNVAACIRESLQFLAPRLERENIQVDVSMPAPPPRAAAYPTSLRRALLNILTNAEQVSNAGDRIEIEVTSSRDAVCIDILDRGPGVSGAERERIFELFVSSRPGGTGLGLFLARTAIERCGGSIEVLDRPGGGSRFRVKLRPASPRNHQAGQS